MLHEKMARKKFHSKREKSEYDQKLLDLARVTRVVKGGRRFRFRATLVIGNRNGKVGVGVAKGADVSEAIRKAFNAAKKKIIQVKRRNSTIACEAEAKVASARVMIKPAKAGRGIVAGGAVRAVIELAGIRDIVSKSMGSANKLSVARATLAALEKVKVLNGRER
jgi:small subunit ribosomal protein S5